MRLMPSPPFPTVPAPKAAAAPTGSTPVSADALALPGGSGDDSSNNLVGSPSIDCGSGRDTGSPNGATNVRRCGVAR
jgi:hypothetical protein